MQHKPIRRYFLAGLLVWIPILFTLLVIRVIVDILDNSLGLIPEAYQPAAILGHHIPGIGVILSLAILFFTGMITTNILGRYLVHAGERIVARIPLVRTIYTAAKQVVQTLISTDNRSFRHVILVEYPRKGMWSIAFETGEVAPIIRRAAQQPDMLTIFIPTTPNPTSGFLMMVPKEDTITLDMPVDDALKLVISLGVVQPE